LSLEDGDIVRVVVNAHLAANSAPVINVFWFEVSELTGVISTSEDLEDAAADAFSTMMSPCQVYQSNQLVYDSAVLENMTNLIDYAIYTPASVVTGALTQESDPGGTALSFKLIRSNRLTRNGSKRIGGIGNNIVDDTTGADLAIQPGIAAIEAAFSTPFDVVVGAGGSCVFTPVIVRRPASGLPVTVHQKVNACVFRGIGSQVSRKRLL